MKTVLPWIVAIACAAGAGALYFSKASTEAELAKAQGQVQQSAALQAQLDEAQKQVASLNDQIASMQKDNQDLLRLRNQIRQLTDEKQQLTKQLENSQSQIERSQAEVQRVQASTAANAQAIAEQKILQIKQEASVVSNCVNNLRQIQAAKQQWAVDQHKTPDSVPTPQDLVAYFPNGMLPQCPGGGSYTLNAVNAMPTCSLPGHALR